ncbi:lipopolysaccharide core biosynthesis protein [Nitzschia inconspicua]|uniref:Lipopolysaccharide core biosynthesis protein n=1 Tax=Nitzschia inconspicua TaxID=303405 RepID=A0A9K3KR64_9STRA|nr:lipopolysaccharide core biosynthesis protein [Nitzschia inconspicua]
MWHLFAYACVAITATALAVLIYPILFPIILIFPWKKTIEKEDRTVIFAASYNPPHNGHLALLQYLSERYNKVVAVIGFNPDKKYPVSPQDRAKLLRSMIQTVAVPNDNIQVEVVEGYIWRYAKRIGATIFFRGIRSWDKDGHDERALQILNTWGPLLLGPCYIPIPTIYMEGDPQYNHVSSTLIRDICSQNGSSAVDALAKLVPPTVAPKVMELYGRNTD